MDPITVLGGSDAGAHVRQIIDAGMPTYALTHWVRDKRPAIQADCRWSLWSRS